MDIIFVFLLTDKLDQEKLIQWKALLIIEEYFIILLVIFCLYFIYIVNIIILDRLF